MASYWEYLANLNNIILGIIQTVISNAITVLNRFLRFLGYLWDSINAIICPSGPTPTTSRRCSDSDVTCESPESEVETEETEVTVAKTPAEIPTCPRIDISEEKLLHAPLTEVLQIPEINLQPPSDDDDDDVGEDISPFLPEESSPPTNAENVISPNSEQPAAIEKTVDEVSSGALDETSSPTTGKAGSSSIQTSVKDGEKTSDDVSSIPRDESKTESTHKYVNLVYGDHLGDRTSDDVSSIPRDESFPRTTAKKAKGESDKEVEGKEEIEIEAQAGGKVETPDQLSTKGHAEAFETVCSDNFDKKSSDSRPKELSICTSSEETSAKDEKFSDISSIPPDGSFLTSEEEFKAEIVKDSKSEKETKTKAEVEDTSKGDDQPLAQEEKTPSDVFLIQHDKISPATAEKGDKAEVKEEADGQTGNLSFDQSSVIDEETSHKVCVDEFGEESSSISEAAIHLGSAKSSSKNEKSSEESASAQAYENIPSTMEETGFSLTSTTARTLAGIHSSIFDRSTSSTPQPPVSPSSEHFSVESERTSEDSSSAQLNIPSPPTVDTNLSSARNEDTLAEVSSGALDESGAQTIGESAPSSIPTDSPETIPSLDSSPKTRDSSTNSEGTSVTSSDKKTSEVTISSNPGVFRKKSLKSSTTNTFTEGLCYRPLRSESGEESTQISELSDPSYGGTASSSDQRTTSTYVKSYSAPPTHMANVVPEDLFTFDSEVVSQPLRTEPSSNYAGDDGLVPLQPEPSTPPRRNLRRRRTRRRRRFHYRSLLAGESRSLDTSEPHSRSSEVIAQNDSEAAFQHLRQLFHYVDREEENFFNTVPYIRLLWLDYYL